MSITEGPTERCECGQSFHFPENLAAHKGACQKAKRAWNERKHYRDECMELRVKVQKLELQIEKFRAEVECLKWSLERRESEVSTANLQNDEIMEFVRKVVVAGPRQKCEVHTLDQSEAHRLWALYGKLIRIRR